MAFFAEGGFEATVESFFVFVVGTDVGRLDFFIDAGGLLSALAVRTGNFETFFSDNERLVLFDDEGGVFVCEEEMELVVRVVEQRDGSREGRTTAAGVVAANVRVVEHRWT